jgi:hypothetical protein
VLEAAAKWEGGQTGFAQVHKMLELFQQGQSARRPGLVPATMCEMGTDCRAAG